MAVSFTKYQDDITRAWREVVDSTVAQKWALFTYEGATNVIKPMATGQEGLDELCEEFNCSLIQYAFCRVIDESLGLNKLVLINWQGDSAPLSRKGICASHVGDVANYFKGCTQTITIRNDDEATKEHLMEQILRTSASKLGLSRQQQEPSKINSATTTTTTTTTANTNNGSTQDAFNDSNSVDTSVSSSSIPSASSVYKKVEIGTDIAASRKSFWQRQEEEEKERLAEEKRRAVEKQAQFEKERKQREELEAKKLAETIKERDLLIEATKKAEKQSAAVVSKPEVSSSTSDSAADDDGRVGRRSELIRLERNQETQSLISKGLIKNKRAIFEQAQQQQQQNQQPTTLSRRGSGAMIAKRVNAFKSMDCSSSTSNISPSSSNSNTNQDGSSSSPAAVHTLTESFNKQVSLTSGDEIAEPEVSVMSNSNSPKVSTTTVTAAIKKEVEPIRLSREDDDMASTNTVVAASPKVEPNLERPSLESPAKAQSNGVKQANDTLDQDDNGNIDTSFSKKSPVVAAESPSVARSATPQDVITNEELIMTGLNSSIKAIALYDYQAADNTEISFDPDDQIGHIQKVDPGWWHGHVISGKFKGLIGLFPANYVQEL